MKIFVAVGTQLAFDRLIRAVDAWAARHPEAQVFAQTGPGAFAPAHIQAQPYLAPQEFKQRCEEADLFVAHAGTGSIFTALELGKPIIVMPRLAKFQEHRNDHQLATVDRFKSIPGVNVAWDEAGIAALLDDYDGLSRPRESLSEHASPELLSALRTFIHETPPPSPRDRVRKWLRALRP